MTFFNENNVDIIVIETNQNTIMHLQSTLVADSSRCGYIRPTILSEILALVVMIYRRGGSGQVYQSTCAMFHELLGSPGYSATTSRNRFKLLIFNISSDNYHTTRLFVGNVIGWQLLKKFLENLTQTIENFLFLMIILH